MINAVLHYQFLQNAVLGALLTSIACGIIGPIIVEKKLLMMSGGIAHTAFGGIGLGYYLRVEPMYTALGFSLFSALAIARIQRHSTVTSDVLIGMFWPLGMALGVLFISFTPGYPPSMSSYLFGDILTITRLDLVIMVLLDTVLFLITISSYHLLQLYLFDEEYGQALGLPVVLAEALTYAMIAITVVVLIRVIGIILILGLLSVPPALARLLKADLPGIMVISTMIGAVFCLLGLAVSYHYNLASGAAIVILSVLTYVVLQFFIQRKAIHGIND
jgi:zinc transport system permease protein